MKFNKLFSVILVFVLIILPESAAHAAGVLYVKPTATGTGDCSSWANACTLQTALGGATSGDEIWVMQGIHTPTTSTDRTISFELVNGVQIYGGFHGTETQRSERDWQNNVTILSGNIGAIDYSGDNSYHVVAANFGTSSSTILDGFTISGGYASVYPQKYGGGMTNVFSSPTLVNLIFSDNIAYDYGAGMYNSNSSPTLINVSFYNNRMLNGSSIGGGLYNESSNPILVNVVFRGNSSSLGGGMANKNSNPILTNTTFSGNYSGSGGGMYNDGSNPLIQNSIFWNNADANGASSTASIANINSSVPSIEYSLLQYCNPGAAWNSSCGTNGGNNLADADPAFVTPVDPVTAPTSAGDLRLQRISITIDLGNNNADLDGAGSSTGTISSSIATDLAAKPRIFNTTVDLGAYENQWSTDDFVITVKTDNTGTSSSTQFTIPTTGGGYNYNVDCDDDSTIEATDQTGNYTCDYGTGNAGVYTIRIIDNSGVGTGFPRIYFNNSGDKDKLLTIEQWGTGKWTSMNNAFAGCTNLTGPTFADTPDLSNVTDLSWMFSGATSFNQYIGYWDTSNITNMSGMFSGANAFNLDIWRWDTSSVTDMSYMFAAANTFNQNLHNWNVSMVTNMSSMFYSADSFNGSVTSWNTGSATNMSYMFFDAVSFDQDLFSWDVADVTDMTGIFGNVTLSTANYDSLLISWNLQSLQSGVTFDGGNSKYCKGEIARDNMTNPSGHNWTITDGGRNCTAYDDFVITIKTDNPGTSSNVQFTIPTFPTQTYNYHVDCDNDGINETTSPATGDYTCNYLAAGTYTIRIKDASGTGTGWTGFPRIYFNNSGDKEKLMTIEQWGTGAWASMKSAFSGCSNLTESIILDDPDLSGVTDLSSMFADATSFNQYIADWNTSNITDMSWMFSGATSFNQDIGYWDTSNITNMNGMFSGANAFNQDISNWNTGHVYDMNWMFYNASSFNQDIGGWDTHMVQLMGNMFNGASSFNQDISNWNTGHVLDMRWMFYNASSFDQNIGGWDVRTLLYADNMFNGVTLSTVNYDALLNGWNAQTPRSYIIFGGGNSKYCNGETARANMISSNKWMISDGGKDCSMTNDFIEYALDIKALGQTSLDTSNATSSLSDPDLTTHSCGITGKGQATVWYKYTLTTHDAISVNTLGSGYDTFIAIWEGTDINNLRFVACNDDTSGTKQSAVSIRVTGGKTYYIEIGQP